VGVHLHGGCIQPGEDEEPPGDSLNVKQRIRVAHG
jgi:hypothetical protein